MKFNRSGTIVLLAAIASLLFFVPPNEVGAGERTVIGRITILDPAARTFAVTDGTGTGWNYKLAADAEIDLHEFKVGDRVSVTVSRATPLNMMSAADIVRKGDKVDLVGGY